MVIAQAHRLANGVEPGKRDRVAALGEGEFGACIGRVAQHLSQLDQPSVDGLSLVVEEACRRLAFAW